MMSRTAPVLLAIGLAGCASDPPPVPSFTPDPRPDHVKLIAENLKTLFSENANPQNVTVSELRQVAVADGSAWGACLRAEATGMSGRSIGQRTIVVVFRRNVIIERRPANPEDCAGAKYTALPVSK